MLRLIDERPVKFLWKSKYLAWGMISSTLRRKRFQRKNGLLVPMGIGLSPTARCNLICNGCYARFYPREDEMNSEVIDRLINSSSRAGVFFYVISGGEPFLRPEVIEIFKKYKKLLFLVITNGTLINEALAGEISSSGNIFSVLSVEGDEKQTDKRRGAGTYHGVMNAMNFLKKAGVPFGFSCVVTSENIS